jgi:hypothetical protein
VCTRVISMNFVSIHKYVAQGCFFQHPRPSEMSLFGGAEYAHQAPRCSQTLKMTKKLHLSLYGHTAADYARAYTAVFELIRPLALSLYGLP